MSLKAQQNDTMEYIGFDKKGKVLLYLNCDTISEEEKSLVFDNWGFNGSFNLTHINMTEDSLFIVYKINSKCGGKTSKKEKYSHAVILAPKEKKELAFFVCECQRDLVKIKLLKVKHIKKVPSSIVEKLLSDE